MFRPVRKQASLMHGKNRIKLARREHQPRSRLLAIEPLENRQLLTAGVFLQGTAFAGSAYLPGATVKLFDSTGTTLLGTATTDASGQYLFDDAHNVTSGNLQPGTYILKETPPAAYALTGAHYLADVDSASVDASYAITVTIGDPNLPTWMATFNYSEFNSLNHGENVASSIYSHSEVGAGQVPIRLSPPLPSSQQLLTYCTDLFDDFSATNNQTYPVLAGTAPAGPVPTYHAGEIAYLYNHYGKEAFPSTTTIGSQSVTGIDQYAGLALAIWELEYDQTPALGSGNFVVTSTTFPGAKAAANNFLSLAAGKSETALFLNMPTYPTSPTTTHCQGFVLSRSFDFDNTFQPQPAIAIVKLTNDIDSDNPTGPHITAGSPVTWRYDVTNPGNEPIASVNVTDNVAGVTPVYQSGDTHNIGQLDTDETWVYTASGVAVAGQYSNMGTVTGISTISNAPVAATNPDHYFGDSPAISLVKLTNGSDNDSTTGPHVAAGSTVTWTYTVTNTGNVALANVVVKDDNGTPGNAADDFTVGTIASLASGASASLTQTGIAVASQYGNVGTATGTDAFIPGNTVTAANPDHYFGDSPAISLVKLTNGSDNDSTTGPHVAAGSTVTWTYTVTNTGNVALANVVVKDDNGTPGNAADDFTVGTIASLASGASASLTQTGIAVAGQYGNVGTATGTDAFIPGNTVTAANPDHYFGDSPAISLVKLTNGSDNDSTTGPHVAAGSTVTWTYTVTNTGNVALANVVVTDDNGTPGNAADDFTVGTIASLAAGASASLTQTGIAVAGQYGNVGTATGTDAFIPGNTVTATNPDHYFGDSPAISLVKLTNGSDNDSTTGPHVMVGSTVTWTYNVTNTGNVPLSDVSVTDNQAGDAPAYQSGDDGDNLLENGETWVYAASGTAAAGQYGNVGTAKGVDAFLPGQSVSATNPDHYFGDAPAISLVKLTNGSDNDSTTGPHVAAGSTVTWTYTVTNTGNVALANVVVTDDNGTPGNAADDFTVGTIASLASGASASLTQTGIAVAGQYGNVGTATGTDAFIPGNTVTAANPDHYFGDSPAISLVKLTNGSDNDSTTGPHVAAGSTVTWTYTVTNTGNVALANVVVTDDNGTPGNAADDFTVGTIASLAAGASASLTQTGIAVAGQYGNVGTATGTDAFIPGNTVTAANPDHYFGDSPAIVIKKYVNEVTNIGGEGLTPGYWKQSQHFSDWVGYTQSQLYNTVFGVSDSPTLTLLGALQRGGGGANALGRHAVAAILNAANLNVNYLYTFAQIKAMVQQAYLSSDFETPKDLFEAQNQLGADLTPDGSTSANGPLVDADTAPGLIVVTGSHVAFTYCVTNPGNVALANVVVTDDNQTPDVSDDDFQPAPVLSGGFNVGDVDHDNLLEPGEQWQFTYGSIAVVDGQHTNIGSVTGVPVGGGNPVSDSNPANWLGLAPDTIDLSLTKTVNCTAPNVNSNVTFTITVSNASGFVTATGVHVQDLLPAGLSYVSSTVSQGTYSSVTGDWNIGTLASPSSATLTVVATVVTSCVKNNAAQVTAADQPDVDSIPNNDTQPTVAHNEDDDDNVTVTPQVAPPSKVDLSITKSDGTCTYTPGTSTTYTIVVKNNGPIAVTNAVVADNFPAAITSHSWTTVASAGASVTATSGTGDINTTVNLASGATVTFTVVAQISSSATCNLVNTATVAAPPEVTDTNNANNSATDTDTPCPKVDLSITKTDGTSIYVPGKSTTYTIVVGNNGPSAVTGAKVADTLPSIVTSDSWTAVASAGASVAAASGTGNLSTAVNLLPGSTVTFTVVAQISCSATCNLVNTATVAAPSGVADTNNANNAATDTDTKGSLGSISGHKYLDLTGNGKSCDDKALQGIKAYVDLDNDAQWESGEPYAVTDSNGAYKIANLLPGKYTVREVLPSGYVRTGPTTADNYVVTVNSGQDSGGNDFYNFQTCCPCAISNVVYIVNGDTAHPITDLGGQTEPGDYVQVRFNIAGTASSQVSLVAYTAPDNYFDANDAGQQAIFDQGTGTFQPGGPYTLTVQIPNHNFQIDFVCGPAIDHFGPAGSNVFYSAQGRLIDADNGGNNTSTTRVVSCRDFATISFWNTTKGQNLIKALNGGASATALATWLATTFPNLYGATAGSNNLTGKTNSQVAAYYVTLYGGAQKQYCQVLAAALAVYVTDSSLAGGTYAASYTFNMPAGGAGFDVATLGTYSSAFGNQSALTVFQMLKSANSQASKGVLSTTYGTNQTTAFSTLVNSVGAIAMQAAGSKLSEFPEPLLAAGEPLTPGTYSVYVDCSRGSVTAAEHARIDDALATLNSELVTFGVHFVETTVSIADISIHVAGTTDIGGVRQGIFAATGMGRDITLVSGWNWYTGADPKRISAKQYDFETVVTHELGHAIGLGHSADPRSAMFPTLAPGQTRRQLSDADLQAIKRAHDAAIAAMFATSNPKKQDTAVGV